MQKVSKQSLAMLALSILLAISIALTFTFAALNASRTATGTITFGDGGSVVWEGSEAGVTITDDNAKFTLTESDFVFSADGKTATLNKTFADTTLVRFTNSSSKDMYYRITIAYDTAITSVVTVSNTTETASATIDANDSTPVEIKLADILKKDSTAMTFTGVGDGQVGAIAGGKITITAEFNFNAAY